MTRWKVLSSIRWMRKARAFFFTLKQAESFDWRQPFEMRLEATACPTERWKMQAAGADRN
jgi:hypothetical protein